MEFKVELHSTSIEMGLYFLAQFLLHRMQLPGDAQIQVQVTAVYSLDLHNQIHLLGRPGGPSESRHTVHAYRPFCCPL